MSFVEMAKGMELKCLQNRCQRSTTDTALDTVDTNIDTACLRVEMAADVAGSKPSGKVGWHTVEATTRNHLVLISHEPMPQCGLDARGIHTMLPVSFAVLSYCWIMFFSQGISPLLYLDCQHVPCRFSHRELTSPSNACHFEHRKRRSPTHRAEMGPQSI